MPFVIILCERLWNVYCLKIARYLKSILILVQCTFYRKKCIFSKVIFLVGKSTCWWPEVTKQTFRPVMLESGSVNFRSRFQVISKVLIPTPISIKFIFQPKIKIIPESSPFVEPEHHCFWHHTVAPLLSPVQEVSTSPGQITIEMHMHDGTEVCHFILSLV